MPLDQRLVVQTVHTDDVADAIARAMEQRVGGAFNLAADPPLDARSDRSALGHGWSRRPAACCARGCRDVAARLQPLDPGWIDLAFAVPRHGHGARRRELGWTPRWTPDSARGAGRRYEIGPRHVEPAAACAGGRRRAGRPRAGAARSRTAACRSRPLSVLANRSVGDPRRRPRLAGRRRSTPGRRRGCTRRRPDVGCRRDERTSTTDSMMIARSPGVLRMPRPTISVVAPAGACGVRQQLQHQHGHGQRDHGRRDPPPVEAGLHRRGRRPQPGDDEREEARRASDRSCADQVRSGDARPAATASRGSP